MTQIRTPTRTGITALKRKENHRRTLILGKQLDNDNHIFHRNNSPWSNKKVLSSLCVGTSAQRQGRINKTQSPMQGLRPRNAITALLASFVELREKFIWKTCCLASFFWAIRGTSCISPILRLFALDEISLNRVRRRVESH